MRSAQSSGARNATTLTLAHSNGGGGARRRQARTAFGGADGYIGGAFTAPCNCRKQQRRERAV
eukprot:4832905-Prymnesium_polylepis.1